MTIEQFLDKFKEFDIDQLYVNDSEGKGTTASGDAEVDSVNISFYENDEGKFIDLEFTLA